MEILFWKTWKKEKIALHLVKALILQICILIFSVYTCMYCDVSMYKVGYMSTVCKTLEDWRHDVFMLLLLFQQHSGTHNQYNIESCSSSCNMIVFEAVFYIVSRSNLQALHVFSPRSITEQISSVQCHVAEWGVRLKCESRSASACVNTAEVLLYFLILRIGRKCGIMYVAVC